MEMCSVHVCDHAQCIFTERFSMNTHSPYVGVCGIVLGLDLTNSIKCHFHIHLFTFVLFNWYVAH